MPIILHHQHRIEVYPVRRSPNHLYQYDYSLYDPNGEFLSGGKGFPSEDKAFDAAKSLINTIEAEKKNYA